MLAAARRAALAAAASNEQLSSALFSAAASAIVCAEKKADILRARTVIEKLAQFLLEMEARRSIRGEIDLPMRGVHIADYLGVTFNEHLTIIP